MMKHLVTIIAAMAFCLSASAQVEKKGTNEFSFHVGYDFGLKKNQWGTLTFQPEYGHFFNDYFYLGGGTGLVVDDKFKTFAIPVFARAEVDFTTTKVRPYVSLQAGYDFSVSGDDSYARLNPMVGVKAPLSNTVDINLGFGYTHAFTEGGGQNFLGFKAGLNFNSDGRGLVRFLQKLDYNVELETYTPFTVKSDDGFKDKYSNFFGLNLAATAPLPLENLYAGITFAIGRFTDKYSYQGEEGDKTTDAYMNAGVRVRYKVKQLTIADKIYPFAQVDMNVLSGGDAKLTVNPAVGLSFMTGRKESVDLTVGYTTMSVDDNDDDTSSKGTLRIALGYTF